MTTPTLLTVMGHKEQHMLPQAKDRRSTHRFRVKFGTLVSDNSGINDQGGDPRLVYHRVPGSSANPGVSHAGDGITYPYREFGLTDLRCSGSGGYVWFAVFSLGEGGIDSSRTGTRRNRRGGFYTLSLHPTVLILDRRVLDEGEV